MELSRDVCQPIRTQHLAAFVMNSVSFFFQTVSRHFRNIPVNEKETLTYFIYMVKSSKAGWTRNQMGANKWNELVERQKLIIYDSTIPLWILAVFGAYGSHYDDDVPSPE